MRGFTSEETAEGSEVISHSARERIRGINYNLYDMSSSFIPSCCNYARGMEGTGPTTVHPSPRVCVVSTTGSQPKGRDRTYGIDIQRCLADLLCTGRKRNSDLDRIEITGKRSAIILYATAERNIDKQLILKPGLKGQKC